MTRRWLSRLAVFVVGDALLVLVLRWADFQPDGVRLSLLVAACLTAAWLVIDTVTESGPPWTVESKTLARSAGVEARLGTYVRILEDHRAADVPNATLRDRLAALAGQRLELHHGLTLGDPAAGALLGPELAAALTGPPRRLRLAELEDFVTRIEEL
jgi:hypothetical protein